MRSVIKISLILLSLAFLFAGNAVAYPVQKDDVVQFHDSVGTTGGGEFGISFYGSSEILFTTFCLEYSEHVNYSSKFTVTDISDGARLGGLGGGVGGYDPISDETRWLYWNYTTGDLADYSGYSYNDVLSANVLQVAIWLLEGEVTSANQSKLTSYIDMADSLVKYAEDMVGKGAYLGDVAVMNIKYSGGTLAQSQLIANYPVPEPSTFVLFGLGGGLLFLARRKNR